MYASLSQRAASTSACPLLRPQTQLIALGIMAVVACAWAYSLGRYPAFYSDNAVFVYPALSAHLGGPFAYAAGTQEPYANLLWAVHGPLLPHLIRILLRVFGFSPFIVALPNFLGGWLAAALLVLWLFRSGHAIAGWLLAILWCGSRASLEILYARMDGLALLFVVLTFLAIEKALRSGLWEYGLLAGFCGGLAALTSPLCAASLGCALVLLLCLRQLKTALALTAGSSLNLPILYWLLDGHLREAATQFAWAQHQLKGGTAFHSFMLMIGILRWSEVWIITVLSFSALFLVAVLYRTSRGNEHLDVILCATFSVGSFPSIWHVGSRPYYLVYFTIWPMLAMALTVEREYRRPQIKVLLSVIMLAWLCSAAWQTMRLRESIKFHDALNMNALGQQIATRVPRDAMLLTSRKLYAVPLLTGHSPSHPLTWFDTEATSCPTCYLLLDQEDILTADPDPRLALTNRPVLYSGPAFPKAGPLQESVLLMGPELSASQSVATIHKHQVAGKS